MSLREDIAADTVAILADTDDLAVSIELTDPAGPTIYAVTGFYNRVGIDQDPQTGFVIAGDKSSVVISISALGGNIPADGWGVEVEDITGTVFSGRIKHVWPDRSLGQVLCMLEGRE